MGSIFNCCSPFCRCCRCCRRRVCCPPCPPTPPFPPPPEEALDILVAAGIGRDPQEFLTNTLNIPFGPALYVNGDAIRHVAGSPEFTILEAGRYQINYQLSAYNPVLESTFPIEVSVNLISNLAQTLDFVSITNQFQLAQRSVTVDLDVAEVIMLQASQPFITELTINSQAIAIVKLA